MVAMSIQMSKKSQADTINVLYNSESKKRIASSEPVRTPVQKKNKCSQPSEKKELTARSSTKTKQKCKETKSQDVAEVEEFFNQEVSMPPESSVNELNLAPQEENVESLFQQFSALDASIFLLRSRKQLPLFQKLKSTLEPVLHRTFSHTNLGQILGVWPEAYIVSVYDPTNKPTNSINKKDKFPPTEHTRDLLLEILGCNDTVACTGRISKVSGADLEKRRSSFQEKLKELKTGRNGMYIIPSKELPSIRTDEHSLSPSKIPSWLQKKESYPEEQSGLSLIEKVRAREKRMKDYQTKLGSPAQQKMREVLRRLPLICDMLHSHFLQKNTCGGSVSGLLKYLSTVCKTPSSQQDLQLALDLIAKTAPEWIVLEGQSPDSATNNLNTIFIRVDKKIHYGNVRRKVFFKAQELIKDWQEQTKEFENP